MADAFVCCNGVLGAALSRRSPRAFRRVRLVNRARHRSQEIVHLRGTRKDRRYIRLEHDHRASELKLCSVLIAATSRKIVLWQHVVRTRCCGSFGRGLSGRT